EAVETVQAADTGETLETANVLDTAEGVAPVKAADTADPVETAKTGVTAAIGAPAADTQDTLAATAAAEMDETAAAPAQHDTVINGNSHSLDRVLADAGMQLIETRHTPAPVITQPPVRLGRARKTVTVVQDEPLQQVETH